MYVPCRAGEEMGSTYGKVVVSSQSPSTAAQISLSLSIFFLFPAFLGDGPFVSFLAHRTAASATGYSRTGHSNPKMYQK